MAAKGKTVKVVEGRDPAETKEKRTRATIGPDQFKKDWQDCIINGKNLTDLIKITCDRFGCSEVAVRQRVSSMLKKLRKEGKNKQADLLTFPNMQGRTAESTDDFLEDFDLEAIEKAKANRVNV